MKSLNREFMGLPLYAWGVGVVVFGIAVFALMRSKGRVPSKPTSASAPMTTTPSYSQASGSSSGVLPVPYPTVNQGGWVTDNNGNVVTDQSGAPIAALPAPNNPAQTLLNQVQQYQQQITAQRPQDNLSWHYGASTSQTKYWRWLPSIAAQYGLPSGPQDTSSIPDPNMLAAQGRFPQGVPLAYSWQYGDVQNQPRAVGGPVYQ